MTDNPGMTPATDRNDALEQQHDPRDRRIRVKVISPLPQRYFMHQFPAGVPVWSNCHFSFDATDRNYDWLVVYEDLPGLPGVPRNRRCEELACAVTHTMLTTTEPSSIKHYGNSFTRQFGCVLTSQEEWALPHSDRIYTQAGLAWIYGVGESHEIPFDDMRDNPPAHKTRDLSMVFSPKRQRHTLHHRRNKFMQQLMNALPEMDVYGRGARPLDDKAEALDAYRYHVAIENFIGLHHWTEKLADAFLGMTLPFYCGCPNATDYFPAESFIPVDMNDPQGAVRIIRSAIAAGEYERRLPAIIEARRRVLHEYNFFALVSRAIEQRHGTAPPAHPPARICSRHALRRQSLANRLEDTWGKIRARILHPPGK
jgi:hypothetical protein